MSGNEFIGQQPELGTWTEDGESYLFEWNKNDAYKSYYAYSLKTGEVTSIETGNELSYHLSPFIYSENKQFAFKTHQQTLYRKSKEETHKILSISMPIQINAVHNDGSAYLNIENRIIKYCPDDNSFFEVVNFSKDSAPKDPIENLDYLEQQQLELFEYIKTAKKNKEERSDYFNKLNGKSIPTIYLDGKTLSWVNISEDSKWMVYELSEYPKNERTHYPSYVTADGHTKAKQARSKVGAKDPTHQIYYYDFELDSAFQLDVNKLSGILTPPEFLQQKENLEQPKNIIFHSHGFNSTNSQLLIEIKSYDNKDRWICTINNKGDLVQIDHQHDEAWIGGPGISGWNMVPGNVGWINQNTCYFQSEKTGYSHLYTSNTSNLKQSQLTNGSYEIHEAWLNQNRDKFFIIANKNHPGNREFYQLNIASRKLTPILTADGNHQIDISPDEKNIIVRYSYKNEPWELYQARLKENTELKQITRSTSDEFEQYDWRAPEVIQFKASDNQLVHARIYEPDSSKKNGAAVIFVHGAGYLQNAHNWWSGYYREFMFNNLLCDKGYTVLDIDYRASKGYGRDFRTGIYRFMGGKDLSDNMDGRQLLIKEYGIDENRIGMYGGSYGGFITLMALLTEPGKFKCGAALRSVTDWAHYNHPYTSNILNTPEKDSVSFRKSSPIYYADKLEDHLLMLHGIEDDNVQYQDVVRLSQRFIELGKENWNLVGYPIERHGFKTTGSWTDEYRRILLLFETHLQQ